MNHHKIILTSFDSPRAFKPQELKKISGYSNAYTADNIKEALKVARQLYSPGYIIVISGSLFLVSEAKKHYLCLSKKNLA